MNDSQYLMIHHYQYRQKQKEIKQKKERKKELERIKELKKEIERENELEKQKNNNINPYIPFPPVQFTDFE